MYSPSKTISVKSGNTFSLLCSYFNDNGTALSLDDTTITADKTSLVNALNELKTSIDNKTSIDDSKDTTANTLSATKINSEITTAITKLINGADISSDTLKELADKIAALAQADNGLVSASQSQTFTEQQKAQARTNIDVYSKAEIGDITTNFVTTINTTYNS